MTAIFRITPAHCWFGSGALYRQRVLAHSLSLLAEEGIKRLGQLERCLVVGGKAVDEAPRPELMVRGLQAQQTHDDDLLAAVLLLIDTLQAARHRTS